MEKVLIGNIKGPKGDQGEPGPQGPAAATGQRGSRWTEGTAITGNSTTEAVFSGTGISDSLVNDHYLNTSTGNIYRCTVAGDASTAKWVWVGNIKGPKGDDGVASVNGKTGAVKLTASDVKAVPMDSNGDAVVLNELLVNSDTHIIGDLQLDGTIYGKVPSAESLNNTTFNRYGQPNKAEFRSQVGFWISISGDDEDDWDTYRMESSKFYKTDSLSTADLGTPSYKWDALYAATGTIQTSDRNAKNTIKKLSIERAKALILGLIPSTYQMNNGTSGRTHWGLISQDVEELLNNLGWDSKDFAGFIKSPKVIIHHKDENGDILEQPIEEVIKDEYNYSIRYDELIAPIIVVVQDHDDRIIILEKTVKEQDEEIKSLKETVQQLKEDKEDEKDSNVSGT